MSSTSMTWSSSWLNWNGSRHGDLNGDCIVDVDDMVLLTLSWDPSRADHELQRPR
ncbi:MAG: hypothetical protein ACYTGC_04620 [Planctomycetota bacterium]